MREPFSQHFISMTQNDLLSTNIHFRLLRSLAEISLRIPWAGTAILLKQIFIWGVLDTGEGVGAANLNQQFVESRKVVPLCKLY